MMPADEIAAFEALKPRLTRLWSEVFAADDQSYTSVVVPSVTLDDDELVLTPHSRLFEEVLLFLLIRLRNPHARVVYVTSQPIPPPIIDYYLTFLAGIPASHAASRLTMLSAWDGTPRSLTAKILERPRLLRRIREAVPDPARAYLTVLRSTPLERRLAVALDLPLNAADPEMDALVRRSRARATLAEAGVPLAPGIGDLRDSADLVAALVELAGRTPRPRKAIVKIDGSYWDEGMAVVTLPESADAAAVRAALDGMDVASGDHPHAFVGRFDRRGGVVEERVEARFRADASVQLRINPLGRVFLTSTHDELRAGRGGLQREGCRFPADDAYRLRLQEAGLRVARVLAERGLASRVSVDFRLWRDDASAEWQMAAHDVNLGVGGSTHPLLAVRFLTGGTLDPGTGLFASPTGRHKYYRSDDALHSPRWRGLLPDDLIDALTVERLNYTPHGESGALFYMLDAISELGRVGLVAIGNTREEADAVRGRVVGVLDGLAGTNA